MYKIVGCTKSWDSILGYQISDENNNKKQIKLQYTYELIEKGKVGGCRILRYKDKKFIKLDEGKLSDLEEVGGRKGALKAVARIESSTGLQGYVLEDSKKRQFKLTVNKVWDIALNGDIENIGAKVINNKKCLIGVGSRLVNLPKITI